MKRFMGGDAFQGAGVGDGIEEVLGAGSRSRGNLGKVDAFGEPEAEKTVGVFDGAFLPGGLGVVDGGVEDLLEGGLVEKIIVTAFRLWLRSVAVGG